LDDLVSAAVERAKARAPEATFVTSLTPVQVRVDPVLVERAVGNLLDNAVKYSPPGAPIEVSVRDGEVVVADHGPGIAEEDLPRIFDRFYRSATARAKPGAGLGLAIVRAAAQAGVVSFARLLPSPLLALPAGVLSDRLDRRRIMLTSDAVRAVAMASLAVVVWQTNTFWPIPLLAFVEGAGDTFFGACLGGVLRSVVPPSALPTAVSVQQGRVAVVGIVGPPGGGALCRLARAVQCSGWSRSYAI